MKYRTFEKAEIVLATGIRKGGYCPINLGLIEKGHYDNSIYD